MLLSASYRHAVGGQTVKRLELEGDLSGFAPIRMEVMEANDARGGVPARICLLDKDGLSYKVFALLAAEEPLGAR